MLNFSKNFSQIPQLFKLVWNRKRSNALMVTELVAAFMVLFFVCLAVLHFALTYRLPLGYEYENVWNIQAYRKQSAEVESTAITRQSAQRLVSVLRGLPSVELASFVSTTPFSFSHRMTSFNRGEKYKTEISIVTNEFDKTMNLTLTQGRWFNASDDAYNGTTSTVKVVVINECAAATFFGKENPIGRDITYIPGEGIGKDLERTRYRVVGVISSFRKGSEFDQSGNFMFERTNILDTTSFLPSQILVKMKPGTAASYEEEMLKKLEQTAPNWSFQITTLAADREKKHKNLYFALIPGLTIAAFLLITVGLGLVGVVWQSVTRRMRELGVRRAFGATRQDIYFFVIGELVALTTFAVVFGLFLVAQVPLIPFYEVPTATYALSICAAVIGMYILTTLCALYPSRLAGTVQPSDALRYE
ncbi:MAG: FtsX-like permease family protein [Candidatus Kapaibacterium sp.]|nr:MAG: FtsX-like permease family protein [Candidatus Kapabacteria bacterium]